MVNYYGKGGAAVMPNVVMESYRYIILSWPAKALLSEFASQYNGYNNGDLCATRSLLKKRGFNSQDTLTKAIRSLENSELVRRTRQGGKDWKAGTNLPTLFAITWQPINECKDKQGYHKLDVEPTTKPHINFVKESRSV